jgi:hypothetical protein
MGGVSLNMGNGRWLAVAYQHAKHTPPMSSTRIVTITNLGFNIYQTTHYHYSQSTPLSSPLSPPSSPSLTRKGVSTNDHLSDRPS